MRRKVTTCLVRIASFLGAASFLASFLSCGTAHAYTPPTPEKYTWRDSWTLYPQDADLRLARRMSIHKKTEPHYLQEWENGSAVLFPVHISEAGSYSINITYSRHSVMKKTLSVGVFVLDEPTLHSMLDAHAHVYAEIPATQNRQDFVYMTLGVLTLPQGTVYLLFTNADDSPHEYVMNLQQVSLEKQ